MKKEDFKKSFNIVAKSFGFEKEFGGWFKESTECIIVLDLQKSNYNNLYYLNIKIYIQKMFGNNYAKSKDLVKKNIGDVFFRERGNSEVFNLDNSMTDTERLDQLNIFFYSINPLLNAALTKSGIKKLADEKSLTLLPAVENELLLLLSKQV
ncbi:uncharacterized protein DUF4304 [Mucilaginibacter yixingensis]|uniref:Uncharacterized protein DUF4304 n=1 Tax=Mucilaginibacter yixingensis TaxID=1295612 RepID=A0A2T5JGW0_9SPHI|nr:DUF4304 domain-containing protein [Mucilaginibacter yixingensis]PTR01657.1 uncharacterized protein DUF4304 [Mucilaginibacter yixingensis]